MAEVAIRDDGNMDAEAPRECVSEDGREVWLHSGRLSSGWMTAMPEWIRSLPAPTSLELSYNQLTVLPDWVGNLTALTDLDLSHNQLTELPSWLRNLTSLTSLHLDDTT
jgi:hypothetical protein